MIDIWHGQIMHAQNIDNITQTQTFNTILTF